ncbi:hypothetical protein ACFE04_000496 [Oxalis oulophora]
MIISLTLILGFYQKGGGSPTLLVSYVHDSDVPTSNSQGKTHGKLVSTLRHVILPPSVRHVLLEVFEEDIVEDFSTSLFDINLSSSLYKWRHLELRMWEKVKKSKSKVWMQLMKKLRVGVLELHVDAKGDEVMLNQLRPRTLATVDPQEYDGTLRLHDKKKLVWEKKPAAEEKKTVVAEKGPTEKKPNQRRSRRRRQ